MLKGNFEENNNRWIQAQLSMAYQTIPISQLGLRVKCVKQSSFFLFFSFSEININNKTKRPSNIWRVNKSTTQIYLLEELDSFLYNYSAWVEWVCFGQWLSIRSLEEFCVIPIQKRERGGGGVGFQVVETRRPTFTFGFSCYENIEQNANENYGRGVHIKLSD